MHRLKPTSILVAILIAGSITGAARVYSQLTAPYPLADHPAPKGPLRPLRPSQTLAAIKRTVVMLVFDGLPGALIEGQRAEHFERLAREGASTLAMEPVFPTLSMPNHIALSTGCAPRRTGIVSNRFIDPEAGLFGGDRRDTRWLLECEPLPTIAERQGVRTAVLGWVAASRGRDALAEVVVEFQEPPISIEARTQQVIDALSQPEPDRPSLILAYYTEPDGTLHASGLGSTEAEAAMRRIDRAVGQVMAALEAPALRAQAALLVVSDHGMMPVSRHLNIGALLRRAGVHGKVAADGSIAHVYLDDPSARGQALAALKNRTEFDAFASDALPDWAPLGTSKRLGDLVLFARPPYYMSDRGLWPEAWRWYAVVGPDVLPSSVLRASHGYPASIPEMRSVFFAWGAGIAAGQHLTEMHSIDVHPTIAMLLGIEPGHPLDGRANPQILLTTSEH